MIDSYLYHKLIIARAVKTLLQLSNSTPTDDNNGNDYGNDNVHRDKFQGGFVRIHRRRKRAFKGRP